MEVLLDSNQLQDRDTVLQLAYFDDGVRLLKNSLSLNFDIDTDISPRDTDYYVWPLHGYEREVDESSDESDHVTIYDDLEKGHGPDGFQIWFKSCGMGIGKAFAHTRAALLHGSRGY